ncbi:MAG: type II toxin-antitoxin system mRNA interferase toxin, RelE/StbE family [Microcystis aeruginosa Ma_QC_Ca_00000000_S207]|uniref:Type II toxin-antitoxin system mRNA interferase toxin, RelE/StbE family n=1 Tax=Microcystis aeruginosa Ma_QC_Ca_00000000_S207 TaxID=2486251 RepID=A0A552FGV6_MICAE|nr:type II toxin-antitoxin system mRNA interferase toxin, RelE/StbE family [Microcystis aeruginosa]MDB9419909.1 type II toxin-antitoxin system mRNA interferase toxin, RelE/StbE family [Microcystis aeruginosa CS-563/04]TRU45940.1 MAG: type II toxin-antitoxin system mRNA interferase toxin, RelE/StbE family [Microcystis aeruginosa Ma_QC_Ca_00000000_S207]
MINIVWDEPFLKILKKWKKKHPDLIAKFENKLTLFCSEPFHSSLKTYRLSGNLKGYLAFSITYEYRLIFKFMAENKGSSGLGMVR